MNKPVSEIGTGLPCDAADQGRPQESWSAHLLFGNGGGAAGLAPNAREKQLLWEHSWWSAMLARWLKAAEYPDVDLDSVRLEGPGEAKETITLAKAFDCFKMVAPGQAGKTSIVVMGEDLMADVLKACKGPSQQRRSGRGSQDHVLGL